MTFLASFQSYYMLSHILNAIEENQSFILPLIMVCSTLIILYSIELIFTIQIYDDIKRTSKNTSSILCQVLSRCHDDFKVLFMNSNVWKFHSNPISILEDCSCFTDVLDSTIASGFYIRNVWHDDS